MMNIDTDNKAEVKYRDHYLETVKKLRDLAYFHKYAVMPWLFAPATTVPPFIPTEMPITQPPPPPGFVFSPEEAEQLLEILRATEDLLSKLSLYIILEAP